MLTLIFDTETTGFPLRSGPNDHPDQPHVVQLCALMTKDDEILHEYTTIIKCPIEVPEAAHAVHGITKERSQKEGVDLPEAVARFDTFIDQADRLVCHNTPFDVKMMKIAYARAKMLSTRLLTIQKVCTMRTAHPIVQTPRWPKLIKAYEVLVDADGFEGAHDARADTLACFKVLRALEKRGVELVEV